MSAGIPLEIGFKLNSSKPDLDEYKFKDGQPYASVADVLATIPMIARAQYKVVNILGVDYWFNADKVSLKVKTNEIIKPYANLAAIIAAGPTNEEFVYQALDTSLTYRYNGSGGYAPISGSLALGSTSSTAYAGDKGTNLYSIAKRFVKDYNPDYNFKGFCIADQAPPDFPALNDVYYFTGLITSTVFNIASVQPNTFMVYDVAEWKGLILSSDKSIYDAKLWLSDQSVSKNFNKYEKAGINSVIDIWFDKTSAVLSPEFISDNWVISVAYLGKRSSDGFLKFGLYLSDKTGLLVLGTNYFVNEFTEAFTAGEIKKCQFIFNINAKIITIYAWINTSKLLFPSTATNGVYYAINNSPLNNYSIVNKRYSTPFFNLIKELSDASGTLKYDGSKVLQPSDISDYKKVSGSDIAAGNVMNWENGYYNASGTEANPPESWGWYRSKTYIRVFAGSVTINTALIDSVPIIVYDKNYNVVRSIGSGTGTVLAWTITTMFTDNDFYIRVPNRQPLTFSVLVNQDIDIVTQRLIGIETTLSAIGVITKTNISTITPSNIYSTCNDLSAWNTSYPAFTLNLYVERLLKLSSKVYANLASSKGLFRSFASRRYYHPESGVNPNNQSNFLETIHTEVITDTIKGDLINDVEITFNHISTKASASAGKIINILQIGDSVTERTEANMNAPSGANQSWGSWEYIKNYFEVDNQVSGARNVNLLGTRNKRTITAGTTDYVVCAEGQSGWTTRSWLYEKLLADGNAFYNPDAVGTVKFSLAKYIERYRTMTDSGVRLASDSTSKGTLVTDVTAYNVCTPNIVIIQLGFSDYPGYHVADTTLLINAIKAEYPNMIVIISYIDAAGAYYPEQWEGWQAHAKDISFLEPMDLTTGLGYSKRLHDQMFDLYTATKALENTTNNIYFIANNQIQPTADSVAHVETNEPSSGRKSYMPFASSSFAYHPNNYAHACWGYHLYSFINYLCANSKL